MGIPVRIALFRPEYGEFFLVATGMKWKGHQKKFGIGT
jgi:hypothetical protein